MTTEEFHDELRKCGFYKVGTGGGCDALMAEHRPKDPDDKWHTEIMLTAFEDASVPEVGDRIHVTIRHYADTDDVFPSVLFVLDTPEQVLAFARSVSCEAFDN